MCLQHMDREKSFMRDLYYENVSENCRIILLFAHFRPLPKTNASVSRHYVCLESESLIGQLREFKLGSTFGYSGQKG